ncbi:MAG: hypothetical protein ABSD40_23880 [Streptosporangiaceae bacterium]
MQVMIDGQLGSGFERLADGLLGRVQQLIHLLVVGEMCARGRGGRELGAGADDGERQVVVDVGVHAGQGELDRLDPGRGSLLDQRPPGQRHRRRIAGRAGGGEVEIGEGHVQGGHEGGVGEEPLAQLAVHLAGHAEVHAVEARQAVTGRSRRVNGRHLRYRAGDRRDSSGRA